MSKLQADIGRQGIVVGVAGVLVVAAVAYVGYSYWQSSHSAKPSDIAPVRANGRGLPSKESEHYQQVLENYNKKNAVRAEQVGDSYLSVMSTRAVSVPAAPEPPASAASVPASTPPPAAPQPPSAPPPQRQAAANPEHDKYLAEQVEGMLANWTGQTHGLATVAKDAKAYADSLMPAAALQVAAQPVADAGGETVVPGYELVPAQLRTNIDTDETSVVEAFIPAGRYAGARVFAPRDKRLGNSVDMTFTGMSWNGRTYKVTAKAVDEHTLRTALSGDVNNRWFSRILLPAVAAGIGRAGQLYQQSGTQTVITPLGGAVVTAPETPSGKAVAGTVIGGIGQKAETVLTQDAAALPVKQVLVPAETTIGIRFLAPVLTGDEVRGAKTSLIEGRDEGTSVRPSATVGMPTTAGVAQQEPFTASTATPPFAPAPFAGVNPYAPKP
jgi:intracellular multiplication protein IcmE